MNDWLSAAIAAAGGIVLGVVLSRLVRKALLRQRNEALREAAPPIAGLVYAVAFVIGLVVALGFVKPEALETIPDDLVEYLPRAFAALIVVVGGSVIGSIVRMTTARALAGSGAVSRYAPAAARGAVLAAAGILAASQLGVDTTIINIAAAALLFGLAATLALLTGLGGRQVASEIAAGRAWRNVLELGDEIVAIVGGETISGSVTALHPTAVEINGGGRTLLVPNSHLLDAVVERRPAADR